MLKTVTNIVNASQITGVLPVANGGTGVTTSTGTGSVVLSAAPTLSGNVTLSTGNLIVASGQGIDFSATPGTGTSELLDDYETGTFTPVLTSGGGGAPTYSSQVGKYTKIGNTVHYLIEVQLSSLGTLAAGNLDVTGLPYNASQYETVIMDYGNFGSLLISVFARTNAAASNLSLYYQVVASTSFGSALDKTNLAATSSFRISGTYFV